MAFGFRVYTFPSLKYDLIIILLNLFCNKALQANSHEMSANCFIITNNMQIKVVIKGRTVLCRRQTDIDSEREL